MRHKTGAVLLIVFTLLFLLAGLSCTPEEIPPADMSPFFKPGAIRVLVLSGHNNHDWRTTTPFLKKLLIGTGRFDVRVDEAPIGLSRRTLAPFDLLVLDYMGPDWGIESRAAVEEFVASGKGIVVVHGASYAFSGNEVLGDGHRGTSLVEPLWEEYAKIVGGVWTDSTGHGDRHSFMVEFTDREHPITKGLGEGFRATDELYHDHRMQPSAKVLATAYDAPEMRGTGEREPILWTVNYKKGRVFYTALGHNTAAMSEPGFVSTFLRGCEWSATGKVTLPAELDVYREPDNLPRCLVVTGGHDFDSEFYSLFDHGKLDWDHAASNTEAFALDIRDRYDVVVLYDMSLQIGKLQRRNLRAFVESGKGLVILHHAIADYNSWDWWVREVVGGKYLLETEGEMPASTYLHDVDFFVRPTGSHPITSGIGPMHIRDETYKGMWISPEVEVILETDEETSDGPLAWISPYEKSRVVYLQLGHDRLAFLHPAYRELVERAILWSAGELE
jgi:type 1 glutamine amidotransferase